LSLLWRQPGWASVPAPELPPKQVAVAVTTVSAAILASVRPDVNRPAMQAVHARAAVPTILGPRNVTAVIAGAIRALVPKALRFPLFAGQPVMGCPAYQSNHP